MVVRRERGRGVGRAEDCSGLDPGRDEDCRDADAEAVEGESLLAGIARLVGGRSAIRRMHMVVDASVLVVGNHEQSLGPGRRLADGLPYRVEELLAGDDVMRRMLVVGIDQEARLQEGILREVAAGAIALEGIEAAEVIEGVYPQIGEHEPGERRDEDGIVVYPPTRADVFEDVKDVANIPVKWVGKGSVHHVAIRGSGMEEGAVGPGVAGN